MQELSHDMLLYILCKVFNAHHGLKFRPRRVVPASKLRVRKGTDVLLSQLMPTCCRFSACLLILTVTQCDLGYCKYAGQKPFAMVMSENVDAVPPRSDSASMNVKIEPPAPTETVAETPLSVTAISTPPPSLLTQKAPSLVQNVINLGFVLIANTIPFRFLTPLQACWSTLRPRKSLPLHLISTYTS
jgi:hypothetical protein